MFSGRKILKVFVKKKIFIVFLIFAIPFLTVFLTLTYQKTNTKVNNFNGVINGISKISDEKITESTGSGEIVPEPTVFIAEAKVANESLSGYFLHEGILATVFWVGEDATHANEYIPNEDSAWDTSWMERYGGIDNPYERNGYYPVNFKPSQNPFYFALPYNDFTSSGKKESAFRIPWYSSGMNSAESWVKNRWIRVIYKDRVCYAQWEDVGPFEMDDFDYVFGENQPKNRVGIDLSPALHDCLHMVTNDFVDWQFVEEFEVPSGPWKETVTTSQVDWN